MRADSKVATGLPISIHCGLFDVRGFEETCGLLAEWQPGCQKEVQP
jgi:hypothetical protein